MEDSIGFKAIIDNDWDVEFSFKGTQLSIKGKNLKLKTNSSNIKSHSNSYYDAIYDDLSLPQKIYQDFQSTEDFAISIMKHKKQLKLKNDVLIIPAGKNKQPYSLPLMSKNQELQFQLQARINDLTFPIKPVPIPSFNVLPYCAVVYIVAYIKNQPLITSSGFLIDKTTVMTVAHSIYYRKQQLEADRVQVFVLSNNGQLKKIKVVKHIYGQNYKTTNQTDLPKYDFAILKLENNNIVTQNMILEIKWNWVNTDQLFQIIGFSQKLDQQLNAPSQQLYHMMCKSISKLQNFVSYMNKAEVGISGAPLVIIENTKYKVIGLHQGYHVNISRAILLSSMAKNPYQTVSQLLLLSSMSKDFMIKAQTEWQKIKQHPQVKKIQNQLKKLEIQKKQSDKKVQNLSKENYLLKKKYQEKQSPVKKLENKKLEGIHKKQSQSVTHKKQVQSGIHKKQVQSSIYKKQVQSSIQKNQDEKKGDPTMKSKPIQLFKKFQQKDEIRKNIQKKQENKPFEMPRNVVVKQFDDITQTQKQSAVKASVQALEKNETASERARHIKQQMDKFDRNDKWHCVIGTNFSCYATFSKFIYLQVDKTFIYLWECSQ